MNSKWDIDLLLSQTDTPVLSCWALTQCSDTWTMALFSVAAFGERQSRDESYYVSHAGLELVISQPPSLSSWYVRPAALHPAVNLFSLLSSPGTPSLGLEASTTNVWLHLFLTCVLGIELGSLCLQSEHLTSLATPPAPVMVLLWEAMVAGGPAHSGPSVPGCFCLGNKDPCP